MKKHIIKISLVISATLITISCNDDFLERKPLDQISNETFWNTESDLRVYNNNLYHIARNENDVPILMGHDEGFDSQFGGIWYLDGMSDNTGPLHSRADPFKRVRAGIHVLDAPSTFGYKGWNFLRAINVGLANYPKAKVTEVIRNKYVGEARLLRGWFYADKVSKFGDVQWVDKEVTTADSEILEGARDPREFVMDKVLEDLNFATQNIPNDWGDGNAPGRLNRWCALAVKARVCLFEGTWRKYHGGFSDADMWLQEAADAALAVMQSGEYSLYSTGNPNRDYNALHQLTDLSGNPEVLYWRRYQLGIFTNHVQSYHKDYNGGASKDMVESYLSTDGLPITLSPLYLGDEVYEDIWVDRDPRLRQSVLHPDDQAIYRYGNHNFNVTRYPQIQGMTTPGHKIATGYHIIKVYENNAAYATYNTSSTPAIILRYGEVLLNFAEAKAELGTITQGDLDMSINLLRDRVAMPHLDLNPPMDPRHAGEGISALLVEIRRERRVELFIEGFRYDDLRRWKQGTKLLVKTYGIRWDAANKAAIPSSNQVTIQSSVITDIFGNPAEYLDIYKGTDFANPVFDENKHYLWPIPINSISQNPNLGQNPGW